MLPSLAAEDHLLCVENTGLAIRYIYVMLLNRLDLGQSFVLVEWRILADEWVAESLLHPNALLIEMPCCSCSIWGSSRFKSAMMDTHIRFTWHATYQLEGIVQWHNGLYRGRRGDFLVTNNARWIFILLDLALHRDSRVWVLAHLWR